MPDPRQEHPETLVGYVPGWRAWNVCYTPPAFGLPIKLHSASWNFVWEPRTVNVATCNRGDHADEIPKESCTCGFYSARTLERLLTMPYHHYNVDTDMLCVVGEVANWGKVVEGDHGWRSAKAYPVKLYLPFEGAHLYRLLKQTYGVPVILKNILRP